MRPIILFISILSITFISCTSSQKISRVAETSQPRKYLTKQYVGLKKKMAIAKFENVTRFGKRRLGENITDVLSTELSKTNRFILLERAEVDKILDQVALSQTGLTEGSLEQIQLMDADFILTGTVTHYAVTTTGSSNLITQSKKQKAEVAADVRIIDVRSGEIILSETGRGISEKEFDKVLGMGESGGYDESLEMDAFRSAVINLTENIISTLDKSPWACDVVKISDNNIYIDAGKKSNLTLGTILDVFQRGEAIRSLSGKIIGYEERIIGSGSIVEFFGADGSIVEVISDHELQLPLICKLQQNQIKPSDVQP
jgi:curli biogenesis system outer membrane secretion channel CsgG